MREEKIHKLEVHVAGICLRKINNEYEVLIAKRSSDRKLYPNKWECGGGQVNTGENFKDGIKRQMKEELGVIVEVVCPLGIYEILVNEEQKKIPGLRFLCNITDYVDKEPKIDGRELVECKWVSVSNLRDYDLIPGILEDIEKAINIIEEREKSNQYLNQLKYLQADFENYKKQILKEKQNWIKFANEELIIELLNIVDDLEIAVKTAEKLNDKKTAEGFRIIFDNLYKILEKNGLKKIDALGKRLDPYYYEVISQEKSDKEDGIILEEFQRGYMLNDKVIRHSKVKVSGDGCD